MRSRHLTSVDKNKVTVKRDFLDLPKGIDPPKYLFLIINIIMAIVANKFIRFT